MGKSYIENSLKRFLKRKVKITLGLVVTFMITGAVSFATENDAEAVNKFKEDLKNQNTKIEEIEKNLQGLGSSNLEAKNYTVKKDSTGADATIKVSDNTIDFSEIKKVNFGEQKGLKIELNNNLTKATKENIVSALGQGNYTNTNLKDNINNGIIIVSSNTLEAEAQSLSQAGKILENKGILIGYQGTSVSGTLINDGLIYGSKWGNSYSGGQRIGYESPIEVKGDIEFINNGLIVMDKEGSGQYIYSTGEGKRTLINNGIISANTGQYIRGGESLDNSLYNYGIIEIKTSDKGIRRGQEGASATLYNYGVIDVSEVKSGVGQSGKNVYNYGLIKVADGLAMNGTNHNYGVIKSSGTSSIFDGTTESNGIVISKNADSLLLKDWAKKDTALFDDKYTLKNGVVLKDKVTNESFGENKIGAVVNGTASIEGVIKDKNIASIVSGNTGKTTVFTSKGNELVLENTNITGYFENKEGGKVLDATASDLTLSGKVNITAVKDQQTTTGEVVAVELGKDKTLTLVGSDIKINGKVNGLDSSTVKAYNFQSEIDVNGNLTFSNITDPDLKGYLKENNFTQAVIDSKSEINKLTLDFKVTADGKENSIFVEDGAVIKKGGSFIDSSSKGNDIKVEIENLETFAQNLDGITFGAGNNTFIVNDAEKVYDKTIDLGAGEDKFVVKGAGDEVFNHHVVNAETVELQGGTWGKWNEAKGTIGFTDTVKAGKQPKLVLGNDTTMNITLNATGNHGSDFANYVGDDLKLSHAVITGTGNNSTVKYLIDEKGLDGSKLTTDKYSFGKGIEYKSAIFNVNTTEGKETSVTVKTASEMGLSGQDRIIYDAYLDQIKVGTANKDVINQINEMESSKEFAGLIKNTSVTGEAYYTAGSVVTMDIADTYLSAVEDFTKRAGKGEWLAQGKYINSDTEFDGGSKVKGYDGDVTGTVGMIEYGFTDNTSYGAVFGMGDSKMDIDGGGKLDGDNTYAGLYMKHRTQNGIELVANLGYVENDMDSVLRNDFKVDGISGVSGNTFEKGTADSSAVILSVKGKKDYRITDTVKVQPILGARATFINQEKAENPEMHFTIKEQDIIVVEGTAGMGIAKEFALLQGKLELNAGVEYTFAATSSTNDAEYTLFDKTTVKLEDVDTAENTGTAFAGFDYEHESGVGFNGKYEMMWSDKGDDSRVTAGISYRF